MALNEPRACLACDEPITPKRIAAIPTATLCLACASALDGETRITTDRMPGYVLNALADQGDRDPDMIHELASAVNG